MKWEAYFADRPLPVRDLKDLKPAKWAGQPRGNGWNYYTPDGLRRQPLPIMINKGEHFFEGTSDKEQELLTYVNDRIAAYRRLGMSEPEEPRASSCVIMAQTMLFSGGYLFWPALLMTPDELEEFKATEPGREFNAQLHVGVKLLCFKGHQVKMLVDRHKSVRITRDELQEMIDAWMEVVVHGKEQALGRKLRKDQTKPSFLAGLAFALAFADRGRRTDLFAQLLNDNTVDRFSAEVLNDPWTGQQGTGLSDEQLLEAFSELERCEVQTDEGGWEKCDQRCSHVALALWHLKQAQGIELPPEALAPPPSPEATGKRKTAEDSSGDEGLSTDTGGSVFSESATPPKRPRQDEEAGSDQMVLGTAEDEHQSAIAATSASQGSSSGGGGGEGQATPPSGVRRSTRPALTTPTEVISLVSDDEDTEDELELSPVGVMPKPEQQEDGGLEEAKRAEAGDDTEEARAADMEQGIGEVEQATEMDVVLEAAAGGSMENMDDDKAVEADAPAEQVRDMEQVERVVMPPQLQQVAVAGGSGGHQEPQGLPSSPVTEDEVVASEQGQTPPPSPPLPPPPPQQQQQQPQQQRRSPPRLQVPRPSSSSKEKRKEAAPPAPRLPQRQQQQQQPLLRPEQPPQQQRSPAPAAAMMDVGTQPEGPVRREQGEQQMQVDAATVTGGGTSAGTAQQPVVVEQEPGTSRLQRSCSLAAAKLAELEGLVKEVGEGLEEKVEEWAALPRCRLNRLMRSGEAATTAALMEGAHRNMLELLDTVRSGLTAAVRESKVESAKARATFWKESKKRVQKPANLEPHRQYPEQADEEVILALTAKMAGLPNVNAEEDPDLGAKLRAEEKRVEDFKTILPLMTGGTAKDDVTRLLGQSKAVLEKLKYRKAFQLLKPLLHDYRRAHDEAVRVANVSSKARAVAHDLHKQWSAVRVQVRQAQLGGDNKTLLLYDLRCMKHAVPHHHVEQPARLELASQAMTKLSTSMPQSFKLEASIADKSPYHPVFDSAEDRFSFQVMNAHDYKYLYNIRKTCLNQGSSCSLLDNGDTYGNEHTFEAASIAVAAALQAVDDVVSGKAYNALVGCRPPGHHAGRCGEPNLGGALQGRRSSSRCSSGSEVGQGFCVLNTVAIAAKHARARWGLMRATVIDIDMHHGNGTEEILCGNGGTSTDYQYISIHAGGLYPHTGEEDPSRHPYVVNLPIAGAVDPPTFNEKADVVESHVKAFRPELLIISAGFDAHLNDPIRDEKDQQRGFLRAVDYFDFGLRLRGLSELVCAGRMVSVMEGGYTTKSKEPGYETIRHCIGAFAQGLAGAPAYDKDKV